MVQEKDVDGKAGIGIIYKTTISFLLFYINLQRNTNQILNIPIAMVSSLLFFSKFLSKIPIQNYVFLKTFFSALSVILALKTNHLSCAYFKHPWCT